jgi:hypothetical protein
MKEQPVVVSPETRSKTSAFVRTRRHGSDP